MLRNSFLAAIALVLVATSGSATERGIPNNAIPFTGGGKLKTMTFSRLGGASTDRYMSAILSSVDGGWNMEDTDLAGGSLDYWHVLEHESYITNSACPSATYCYTHYFTHSSPWHASTTYPGTGDVVIK